MGARLWLPAAFAIVSPIVYQLPVGFQRTLIPEPARILIQQIAKQTQFGCPELIYKCRARFRSHGGSIRLAQARGCD